MSTLPRNLADALVLHAGRRVASPWGEAMRGEIECIENDVAALGWAVGCVVASYKERITSMRTSTFSPLLGFAALILFAFGGFVFSGGHLAVILEALPHLIITIVLGALAATTILTTAGGPGIVASLGRAFRGRKFERNDYGSLANVLSQTLSGHAISLPDLAGSRMIADASQLLHQQIPPDAMATVLQGRIDAVLQSERRAVRVLKTLTQALLWFGAIAVSLGLEKVLSSIGLEPIRVIYGMASSASSGAIIGVIAAAGIVLPLAIRLDAAISADASFYGLIKTAFVCCAAGADPALAVRTALGALPDDLAPGSEDMAAPLRPLTSGA